MIHAQLHRYSKLFKCEVCDVDFDQNQHLKVQIILHVGKQSHSWPRLSGAFRFSWNETKGQTRSQSEISFKLTSAQCLAMLHLKG